MTVTSPPQAPPASPATRSTPAPLPRFATPGRISTTATPVAMVATLVSHRDLIWQMARREVVGRYRGSVLGLFWSFFHPLLMLAVYTFAFSYVLKQTPRGEVMSQPAGGAAAPSSMGDSALYIFSGLILYNLFAEVVTRAPHSIMQNANYVKKVVFPLQILPAVSLLAALIHACMSILVLLLGELIVTHHLPLTAPLAPLALIPLLLFVIGAAWFLSAAGVYLRDIGQMMGVVAMVMMWLSPVFYSVDKIPNSIIQHLIRMNPLTIPLEGFRALILDGTWPHWSFVAYTGIALIFAWMGFAFFQRVKRGFADVL